MHFDAEHHFDGPPKAVAALLTDPNFYTNLALPDLSEPQVLEHNTDGSRSLLRLRYEFVGSLDATARRLLGENRLGWNQDVTIDGSTNSGEVSFQSSADPKRLHGSAHFDLQDHHGRCVRRLEGELVVAVPVIGPRAERKIVPGVLRRLDIEAEALNKALTQGRR